jgi:hypothetical protein
LDVLGRARSFFKGLGAPAEVRVQYYSVVCPLGHRVRGQRTEGYQALRCPVCAEGVFILPASPLPDPVAPEHKAATGAAATRPIVDEGPVELRDPVEVTVELDQPDESPVEAEIIWDDSEGENPTEAAPEAAETDTAADRSQPTGKSRAAPGHPRAKSSAKSRTPSGLGTGRAEREPALPSGEGRPGRSRSQRAAQLEPQLGAEVPERLAATRSVPVAPGPVLRSQRPFLILASVIALVAGTILLRTWRSWRGDLPEIARVGHAEGIPALEEGKFDKANQLLSAAKEAVDSLGAAVDNAEEIRHAADEAAIFVNLLSDSLETLLEEASRSSAQAWATRFFNVYKGRSVIIDATITATPQQGGKGKYEIDYLVLTPGEGTKEQRFARIDLDGFEAITLAEHKVGDRVVFGAVLAAFEFDVDAGNWVIRLEPKTGVSISHMKALEALGWPGPSTIPDPGENGEGAEGS